MRKKYVVKFHTGFDEWMYATHDNPFTYNSETILFESQNAAVRYSQRYTEAVVEEHQQR